MAPLPLPLFMGITVVAWVFYGYPIGELQHSAAMKIWRPVVCGVIGVVSTRAEIGHSLAVNAAAQRVNDVYYVWVNDVYYVWMAQIPPSTEPTIAR